MILNLVEDAMEDALEYDVEECDHAHCMHLRGEVPEEELEVVEDPPEDEKPEAEEEEVAEEEAEEYAEEPPVEEEPQEELDPHPWWRYSKCDGNRKALLVGVNYFQDELGSGQLEGCINDANNVKELLLSRGYEEENMRVLTDDQEDPELQPTRENMIAAMQWLVEDAQPDDALFFHFSGHGGTITAMKLTVKTKVDYKDNGNIVDDELHEILVAPLPIGCRLTILFDCCRSGSGADLPYMYNEDGNLKEPGSVEELKVALAYHVENGDAMAIKMAADALTLAQSGEADVAHETTVATKTAFSDVIFFSGCSDAQTSSDEPGSGTTPPNGAMSSALLAFLEENPEPTYQELLTGIHAILDERGHPQRPQLSSSHPMDISLPFVF